jgi:hypothetical protein
VVSASTDRGGHHLIVERAGLFAGLGLLAALAALVGVVSGTPPAARPEFVTVEADPEAQMIAPTHSSDSCRASPETGSVAFEYRIAGRWTELRLPLCTPPTYLPGGALLFFAHEPTEGPSFGADIPAGGWVAHQRWRGADARIQVQLDGRVWGANDSALPCHIRTEAMRLYAAPARDPFDNATVHVAIGGTVRARFACTGIPPRQGGGPALDLRGQLSVRNCEGASKVDPAVVIEATCGEHP